MRCEFHRTLFSVCFQKQKHRDKSPANNVEVVEKTSENMEKPLNDILKKSLGEDPSESKSKKLTIHSKIISHWQYYSTNGLDKEERNQLINQFVIPEGLAAPKLNQQIHAQLSEKSQKKDGYRYEVQRSASAAVTALSAAITMINDADENGLDPDEFTDKLVDAGKLISDVQYKQSETRKAFITPRFSKSFQEILKNAKPGELLFGNDLSSKIKETKDSDKLFKSVTTERSAKYQVPGKNQLNSKRLLEQRPPSNRAGNIPTEGQAKPRLYFRKSNRGRKYNQPPRQPLMVPTMPKTEQ